MVLVPHENVERLQQNNVLQPIVQTPGNTLFRLDTTELSEILI